MASSRISSGATAEGRSAPAAVPTPRLLAAVAALACAAAAPVAAEEAWRAFAPPGGGFRVELPGAPQRESDERATPAGSVRETRYWLRVEGAELSVETHDVPLLAAALMSDAALLDRARDGVIENEGGVRLESRALTLQGAPARAFTYRYPGEPTRLERALTVLVGRRLFLLTGTGSDPGAHPAVARFFASFRLEPPGERASDAE